MSADTLQTLFSKAVKRLQQGDAAAAKKGLLKVVKQLPDSAVVWYNLGLSHQYLDEHKGAIEAYRKTVNIQPSNVDGWVNLGLSYKLSGDLEQAESAAQRAAANDPNYPRALNLLGTLAAERGERERAKQLFEKCIRLDPGFANGRLNLASLLVELDDNEAALETATPLLDRFPENKEYRQLIARIFLNQKKFDRAAPIVLSLQEDFPDDEGAMRLGLSYREVIRDHFGAIEMAQKILPDFPDDAGVHNSLGNAYFQLDSIAKARESYETAIRLDPEHPEYENNLGLSFSSLGDKTNAELHYRRSIELNPEHAEAYRNITAMKRFKTVEDPDAARIEELWNRDDLDDFTTIKLSFALGKVYDDCGAYADAFKTYKRGNDLKFKESRIDLDKYFAHIRRIPEVFDSPPDPCAPRELEPRPIFILGMPRSGTTLVEQILSRHPEVFGCGELPCVERAINRLEKKAVPMRVYPDDFRNLADEVYAGEAAEYVTWVGRLHDIDSACITDKMPFNFVHVWLIKALFPGAPVVHCQRHPLDVITSNYFQLYGSDISFVYDLEALATYYVCYYRLMEHWQRVFGDGITRIVYEKLIQDTDNETMSLVEAIGLPWDDACYDPSRSGTAVRTASIWQVRQGIYTSSKERWRNYETELKPAIDILLGEGILEQDLGYRAG